MGKLLWGTLLLLLPGQMTLPALAAETEREKEQFSAEAVATPNKEILALFADDQAARQTPQSIDWEVVAAEDAERRNRVNAMLANGELTTGLDYYRAAFIFQHGSEPDEYLKAHHLALAAMALGYSEARWIAAATLDRYLQNIDQPQIYGTQFLSPPGQATTQDPYNRNLISDAERELLGVPPLSEQENQRIQFD